ncbi:adenosine kinase-like [Stegodyphus dumicola]|uniref:adenosine kinase-like n=1 Tax=Stegodyphus dumicola TaxID=202533 RepID=UPI0015B1A7EB|nr:adenosine kinase-like [Stegodyphus dumicola]
MEGSEDGCKKRDVRLFFIGHPLLDLTTPGNPELLQKYGLEADGSARPVAEHEPLFHYLFKHPDTQLLPGGSAQNSARIANWVLGDRGKVSFAGCVGDDEFGSWMAEHLRSEGVKPLYAIDSSKQTGVCACLLTPGNHRSLVARLSASASFSRSHLFSEDILAEVKSANCIFVAGYFLAHCIDAVFALIELCQNEEQLFCLSLSAEYVCREHTEVILKVMPRVDVLFGNAEEVKALARAMHEDKEITDLEDAIQDIAALPREQYQRKRIIIVSSGAKPVLVYVGSECLYKIQVPTVSVVDSVGCGDALAGGFLAHYVVSGNVEWATKAGIEAATRIAQVNGCNPPQDCCPIRDFPIKW